MGSIWVMHVKQVFALSLDICGPDSSCRENETFECVIQILTIISDAVNVYPGHLYIWAICHAQSVVKTIQYLIKFNQHGRTAQQCTTTMSHLQSS